jgi:hypothetical protein
MLIYRTLFDDATHDACSWVCIAFLSCRTCRYGRALLARLPHLAGVTRLARLARLPLHSLLP